MRLQTAKDYERQLAELDQLIAASDDAAEEFGGSFALDLQARSLRSRRDELARTLRELGDEGLPGQELSIVLDGKPVVGHTVQARFLSVFLHDLQNFVHDSVAGIVGGAGRYGPRSKPLLQRSSLRVTGAFAGSFGLAMEADDRQFELEGIAVSPLYETIESLFFLLSGDASEAELLNSLVPLSDRARNHYRKMLNHMRQHEADVEVRWLTTEGQRSARLGAQQAKRRLEHLEQVRENTFGDYYHGVLDGAVKRTGHFEYRTEDGELISGRFEADVASLLKDFYDRPSKAYIKTVEITNLRTQEQKTFNRLQELSEPDRPLKVP